ncbi:MAG: chorismate synthase [Cenarchaeum symbiont of Oopsacas minuta]|nr:chorismate synthase [Cenarchaeum symbiont of Oopsacas minuta]
MSSSIGKRLVLTSFGESHGKCIGTVLDGCPAGLKLDEKDIQPMLNWRRPGQSVITTQRREGDVAEILSGTFRGKTTGAPIAVIIWNKDKDSRAYDDLVDTLRPGHADYPAMVKYSKYNDWRGGGRFSGRLTATHIMGGAIARKLLAQTLKVKTDSYVIQIGEYAMPESNTTPSQKKIYSTDTRCPHVKTASDMKKTILDAKKNGDSLGGIVKSVTSGVPVGLGEPIFDSIESEVAKAIYSIPSVKGIEFGSGFAGSSSTGSKNNDIYKIDSRKKIITKTNNSGGILGGLSIGMPIVMNIAFKPVSSISMRQRSVKMSTKKSIDLYIKGRHDPCVVPRAPPIVDALVSLSLADLAIRGGFIPQVIHSHGQD